MCPERAEVIIHLLQEQCESARKRYAQEQCETQEWWAQVRRELQEEWAQVRRELNGVERTEAFIKETDTISLAALGQGKDHGGTFEHQQLRFEVLDRLRDVAWLTPCRKNSDIFSKRSGTRWGEYSRTGLGVVFCP